MSTSRVPVEPHFASIPRDIGALIFDGLLVRDGTRLRAVSHSLKEFADTSFARRGRVLFTLSVEEPPEAIALFERATEFCYVPESVWPYWKAIKGTDAPYTLVTLSQRQMSATKSRKLKRLSLRLNQCFISLAPELARFPSLRELTLDLQSKNTFDVALISLGCAALEDLRVYFTDLHLPGRRADRIVVTNSLAEKDGGVGVGVGGDANAATPTHPCAVAPPMLKRFKLASRLSRYRSEEDMKVLRVFVPWLPADLERCEMPMIGNSDVLLDFCAKFGQLKHFRVHWGDSQFPESWMEALSNHILSLHTLEDITLPLSRTTLTRRVLFQHTKVTRLSLQCNQLTRNFAGQFPNLTSLALESRLPHSDLSPVVFTAFPELAELKLKSMHIPASLVPQFALLKNLEVLSLKKTCTDRELALEFARALGKTKLRRLVTSNAWWFSRWVLAIIQEVSTLTWCKSHFSRITDFDLSTMPACRAWRLGELADEEKQDAQIRFSELLPENCVNTQSKKAPVAAEVCIYFACKQKTDLPMEFFHTGRSFVRIAKEMARGMHAFKMIPTGVLEI